MMFWIGVCALSMISAIAVLWPMRAGRATLDRADQALAIFTDQLSEVDRDEARGVISGEDAEAARTEIKRRMLGANKDRMSEPSDSEKGQGILIASALLVPVLAALIYVQIGSLGMPSVPFAERQQAQQNDNSELVALVGELKQRLAEDPNGGETRGWELLGTTSMNMGRFDDAVRAFGVVTSREGASSGQFSRYAEALISAENGIVTPEARAAINTAMELDPLNPAASYYAAIALEQDGQILDARKVLLERVAQETAPQPWMETFIGQANRMGAEFALEPVGLPNFAPIAGPSAEDIEAAGEMSEEDRGAFIRSMVARLAERMEDEPENLDGWLQLARAYMVLGETENAREALLSAKPLADKLSEDAPQRLAVEQGLAQLDP
jgi:cytochrome c-type biogenesis protein CcmH